MDSLDAMRLDPDSVHDTLGVLLKYQDDISRMQGSEAKRILDPDNLLNPGVLVDPAPFDTDLRLAATMAPVRTTLRLAHDHGSFGDAVHRCTGVGKCVADNTANGGVLPVQRM